MSDTTSTHSDVSQIDKFKAAAKALECNEDEDAFKRSLRAIAKAPFKKPGKAR